MKYKSLITALLIGSAVVLPGCKDEFAEVNTDQSVVTQPDIVYLFTQAMQEFEPAKYQQWFYNNLQYTMPWVQATIYDGGNASNLNVMGAYESASAQVVRVKTRVEEIDYLLSLMQPEEAATYDNIRALCNPLLVFLGIFGTDMYGSMPYSETGKGLVTDPPLLAPAYETQEELFDLWEKQLNETLTILGESRANQVPLRQGQDFVYKNDLSKWARFTNSLKLKLAVRLIHVDKARALRLASEVANHSAGIMSSLDHDFFFCRGSQEYHFGDDLWHGRAGQNLINFMVDNKDPRVRFMFMKNDFNSKVVQALYDEGVSLPDFIEEKVNSTIVDGKKVFESWKSPGEPWIRYIGAPVDIHARDNGYYVQNYFNTDNFKIGDKKYNPLSLTHIEMIRGQYEYTFPDSPNATAVKDNEKNA